MGLALCYLRARGETWTTTDPATSNSIPNVARDQLALGYRAISLSATTNLIAAVWLRDYKPADLQLFVPYTGLESNTAALAVRGFRPVNVAVYGQIPNESYLISYINDGQGSSLHTRLSADDLAALGAGVPGSRVAWLQSSGAGNQAEYAALLAQDGLGENSKSGSTARRCSRRSPTTANWDTGRSVWWAWWVRRG